MFVGLRVNRPKSIVMVNAGFVRSIEPWGNDKTIVTFTNNARRVFAERYEDAIGIIAGQQGEAAYANAADRIAGAR